MRHSKILAALVILASAHACKAVTGDGVQKAVLRRSDSVKVSQPFSFAHGVRVYVSAVNCEMNGEDAERINALSRIPGLAIEVVFAGITGNDSAVVQRARADLGLTVPVRLIRTGELEQYKSIGGASLPMALVIKGRQLKTIVGGEAMPRTVSIVEASLSLIAPPNHHQ